MDFERPKYENDVADWGFAQPDRGWYLMDIEDGAEISAPNDAGKTNLRIPMACAEHEFKQSFFVTIDGHKSDKEAAFNKKKVADLLIVTKMWDLFEKNFPGQTSMLDPRMIQALQTKLVGRQLKIFIDEGKADAKGNVYMNIKKLAPANYVPPAEGDAAKPAAKGKSAAKPAAAAKGQQLPPDAGPPLEWG